MSALLLNMRSHKNASNDNHKIKYKSKLSTFVKKKEENSRFNSEKG